MRQTRLQRSIIAIPVPFAEIKSLDEPKAWIAEQDNFVKDGEASLRSKVKRMQTKESVGSMHFGWVVPPVQLNNLDLVYIDCIERSFMAKNLFAGYPILLGYPAYTSTVIQ